jgi:RNA polymerase-binding transcription factor DksA
MATKKTTETKAASTVKKSAPATKAATTKSAPVKKAAPSKTASEKPAATKAAPTKSAPSKNESAKSAPTKAVAAKRAPAKASTAKPAPLKAVPEVVAPAKKVTPPHKAPSTRPEKKKLPAVSPETRFAETSKPASSPALVRKALREKEAKKENKVVAMPKINSTSSRKYEPEFTRSVLDAENEIISTVPSMRYSDAELAEFKELIQNKLNAAKQELSYLNGLITRKDSMSGGDADNRYMTMEDGSLSMEREQLSQMAARQLDFLEKLEKAKIRIENKTYGICRVSGKLIDKARLRAVPHATLSMESKMGMNKR